MSFTQEISVTNLSTVAICDMPLIAKNVAGGLTPLSSKKTVGDETQVGHVMLVLQWNSSFSETQKGHAHLHQGIHICFDVF